MNNHAAWEVSSSYFPCWISTLKTCVPKFILCPTLTWGKKKERKSVKIITLACLRWCSCLYHLVFLLYRQNFWVKKSVIFFLYKGERERERKWAPLSTCCGACISGQSSSVILWEFTTAFMLQPYLPWTSPPPMAEHSKGTRTRPCLPILGPFKWGSVFAPRFPIGMAKIFSELYCSLGLFLIAPSAPHETLNHRYPICLFIYHGSLEGHKPL